MLQIFVDDSGNAGSAAAFMAGLLSTDNGWSVFSKEWKAILDEEPVLKYFKMNEAAACKGQFYGWSSERRDQRLGKFVDVMLHQATMGVVSGVKVVEFKSLWKNKFDRGTDSLHYLLFHNLVAGVVRHQLDIGEKSAVDFTFDEQGKESTKAVEDWDDLLSNLSTDLCTILTSKPKHRDDLDTLPLQAADMFAWLHHRRFHIKSKDDISRKPIMSALDSIPTTYHLITAADLIEIVSALENRGHRKSRA